VKAILGTIGHRLCERAALGPSADADPDWDSRFDAAWAEEADHALERYPELGPTRSWAGFNLQKALWRSKARGVAGSVGPAPEGPAPDVRQEQMPDSGVEVRLSSADGKLVGTADVVTRHGDRVEIRDLKSGRTLDEAGDVSEPYRIQLLLYGLMYEDSFGLWPSRLVIDPIVRPEVEIEPDHAQAIRYRATVLDAMSAFEGALSSGDIESLAKPSATTCRFCPHVSRCRPFWSVANRSWEGMPRALIGTVSDIFPGTAVISVTGGTIDHGIWTIGGIGDVDLRIGDLVEIASFEHRGDRKLAWVDLTSSRVVSRMPEAAPTAS
jgi:hypothetical protein